MWIAHWLWEPRIGLVNWYWRPLAMPFKCLIFIGAGYQNLMVGDYIRPRTRQRLDI